MAEQLALTFPSDTFFFCGRWSTRSSFAMDSSSWDWVTKYLIIYVPNTHYPISLCFLLGYGVCSVPQVVAISPSSERQHGGSPWRTKDGWRSEYTPFTALFVMEARCIIYVAGQGSSRITDGVIMCNSALLHFLPIKNTFSIWRHFFYLSLWEIQYTP